MYKPGGCFYQKLRISIAFSRKRDFWLKNGKEGKMSKAADLMRPRFEVVALYPGCEFLKGHILIRVPNATNDWYHAPPDEAKVVSLADLKAHPHLFRELNWWEYRRADQMPSKLICKAIPDDTEVLHVVQWDMDRLFGYMEPLEERKGCGLMSFKPEYGYFPVD